MKASNYVEQRLFDGNEAYGARFAGKPRVQMSFRIPVELIAWIDAFKAKGLGSSRNEVLVVLLDLAVEQIAEIGTGDPGFGLQDFADLAASIESQLEVSLAGDEQ